MSIATALTALANDVDAARTAITAKGGTVTADGGSSQLATDIATIPSGGGGGLPDTYQQVEYIEDTGHQCIVSDITYLDESDVSYVVDIDVQSTLSEPQSVFGIVCCVNNNDIGYWTAIASTRDVFTVGGGISLVNSNVNQKTHLTVTWLGSTETLTDGVDTVTRHIDYHYHKGDKFCFFNMFDAGRPMYGKIFGAKIHIDNELVADYVPCYRKNDGQIGLYNIVTQTFCGNRFNEITYGTFLKGADVNG